MRKTTGYGGERWLQDTTESYTESALFTDKDGRGYGQPRVEMADLQARPAINHDRLKMELSRDWQPSHSSDVV